MGLEGDKLRYFIEGCWDDKNGRGQALGLREASQDNRCHQRKKHRRFALSATIVGKHSKRLNSKYPLLVIVGVLRL